MNIFKAETHPKIRSILIQSSLSFLRNGYHGISMRCIAEQVGLQKGSLYHYFPSKIELAITIVQKLNIHADNKFFTHTDVTTTLKRLFQPNKDDIDMQLLAILPMSVYAANDIKLQQAVVDYYQKWINFFSQHEISANENKFHSWLGYWSMATIV